MKISPPFVVDDKYLNGTGLRDPSEYWTQMAPNIHLLEKRIEPEAWDALGDTTLLFPEGSIKAQELYKPVYSGREVHEGVWDFLSDIHKALGKDDAEQSWKPVSYWLRVGMVPAYERDRYPFYVSKSNYMEGLDLLNARELFSWDGTGWKLRETNWGKD